MTLQAKLDAFKADFEVGWSGWTGDSFGRSACQGALVVSFYHGVCILKLELRLALATDSGAKRAIRRRSASLRTERTRISTIALKC
ncbi:hypothetical protein FHS83_000478 [Rhizomicrobium palustre]|uniref:Uncharacterized protein n=1 Tax=Rhizomicrobium palustre TaxID=189966 RepID=A0A846MVS9_9PROT|nr:hypothetical protein [Rhizomicrobium palustre]NIK87160.1 hypothetical protein [Rhizomicrobium palustre]